MASSHLGFLIGVAEEAEAQRKLADIAAIAEQQKWIKQRSEEAMAQQDRAKKEVDEQVGKIKEGANPFR